MRCVGRARFYPSTRRFAGRCGDSIPEDPNRPNAGGARRPPSAAVPCSLLCLRFSSVRVRVCVRMCRGQLVSAAAFASPVVLLVVANPLFLRFMLKFHGFFQVNSSLCFPLFSGFVKIGTFLFVVLCRQKVCTPFGFRNVPRACAANQLTRFPHPPRRHGCCVAPKPRYRKTWYFIYEPSPSTREEQPLLHLCFPDSQGTNIPRRNPWHFAVHTVPMQPPPPVYPPGADSREPIIIYT